MMIRYTARMKYHRIPFRSMILALAVGMLISLVPYSFVGSFGRPQSTMLNVPYTTQAPLGEWSDPRQADGCEEAALVMAMAWLRGGSIPPEEAKRDIINMSEYERVKLGFYQDTSMADTGALLKDYYGHSNYIVQYGITSDDIKNELAGNRVVLIPLNTQRLGGVYGPNGPPRHTVVAVGYDDQADTITIHDPYQGGEYRAIPSKNIDAALWDYNSGVHLPLPPKMPAMLVVYP
jgi:hypothetical protein